MGEALLSLMPREKFCIAKFLLVETMGEALLSLMPLSNICKDTWEAIVTSFECVVTDIDDDEVTEKVTQVETMGEALVSLARFGDNKNFAVRNLLKR